MTQHILGPSVDNEREAVGLRFLKSTRGGLVRVYANLGLKELLLFFSCFLFGGDQGAVL